MAKRTRTHCCCRRVPAKKTVERTTRMRCSTRAKERNGSVGCTGPARVMGVLLIPATNFNVSTRGQNRGPRRKPGEEDVDDGSASKGPKGSGGEVSSPWPIAPHWFRGGAVPLVIAEGLPGLARRESRVSSKRVSRAPRLAPETRAPRGKALHVRAGRAQRRNLPVVELVVHGLTPVRRPASSR